MLYTLSLQAHGETPEENETPFGAGNNPRTIGSLGPRQQLDKGQENVEANGDHLDN
jgi:hypothetical protein